MYVYRVCSKEEIDIIFHYKSFESVGDYGSKYIKNQKERNINNHNYEESERYLHFFKKKESICHMDTDKGKYICVYDIPEDILNESYGIGKYWEFINYSILTDIEEYAVKSNKIKFDYLVKVDRINKYIDAEDYLYNPSLKGYIETIYENGFNNNIETNKHKDKQKKLIELKGLIPNYLFMINEELFEEEKVKVKTNIYKK